MVYELDKWKIGERIREERSAVGLSQEDFAVAVGLDENSRQQVIKWENGHCLPPFNRLLKMCEVFDCEIGYLLCEPAFECKTRAKTDIKAETGLSQKSIDHLIVTKYIEPEYMGEVSSDVIDLILKNDNFWREFDDALPMYIAKKYFHNASIYEVDITRFSLNSIFEKLIEEIGYHISKTSPLKPLPKVTIKKELLQEQEQEQK